MPSILVPLGVLTLMSIHVDVSSSHYCCLNQVVTECLFTWKESKVEKTEVTTAKKTHEIRIALNLNSSLFIFKVHMIL